MPRKNVKVVVLGDIGRSPRMQYHCLSLSEMGHCVDVIGYGETDPMGPIKENPSVYYHYLCPVPQVSLRILNYIFKTIFQSLNLLFLLFITRKADYVLMQNPPAVPTMGICWLYSRITGAKFVIDWHNYAHTIMGLNLGDKHKLVKVTKAIETVFGRKADSNLCVTNAMKQDLRTKWGIDAVVLYDRPPSRFKVLPPHEKHSFLQKFERTFLGEVEGGVFTEVLHGELCLKKSKPGLLVSSTSWTEDEDFSVLLAALQDYEDHIKEGNVRELPPLVCAITGKGPLKSFYERRIAELSFKHVRIVTPWLESDDYPLLLASADFGVSLHTSSSGLDLPMKVVDMFGCGLPVTAYNFKCLGELVKHGENSFIFNSTAELSAQILSWFEAFPNNETQKALESRFKTELTTFQNLRWGENWSTIAAPIFS